jgi:putative transposase
MPRRSRCVLPGVACHITQRGVDRRATFSDDGDRRTYLRLLQENLAESETRLLGFCLMTNHVHLIAVPERQDSLSILLRRVHGRYAQYYNVRAGRTGHLWQNRFFACVLEASHLWTALAYVERNPVRAAMVSLAEDYPWSSARAHLTGEDPGGLLDMEWWRREAPPHWRDILNGPRFRTDDEAELRACTYAGRPYGSRTFLSEMSARFGRRWDRPQQTASEPEDIPPANQLSLF